VAAQANISRSVLHRFLTEPDATITLTTAESIAKAIGYKIVFKKVKR
jgi:DNA-binding phage protein